MEQEQAEQVLKSAMGVETLPQGSVRDWLREKLGREPSNADFFRFLDWVFVVCGEGGYTSEVAIHELQAVDGLVNYLVVMEREGSGAVAEETSSGAEEGTGA